ncbi:MAG: hypothetical protein A4S15_08880 [Candidatus Raskinella chloraquaticus]|uniref:Extensin-like C-terminal domain-containing protein n=1 Tax=Candidatus Raskinella chloraquaticus TaxID=1951219 RepID=A0A1W9HYD4_9HYPH|nr:MAG: hypothetical protein A4S15_08880 [Proteobacteria bacterium SG_bin8]
MKRYVSRVAVLLLLVVASCGRSPLEQRAQWRGKAEEACLRAGLVRPSAHIRALPPINPGGLCGADHPFSVEEFARASARLDKAVPLNCQMIAATDYWLENVVQPAALASFGQRVREVKTYGTYSCRRILNRSHGALSEHAFVNAIDVAGFVLEDGRKVMVGKPDQAVPSPWRLPDQKALGVSLDGGGLDLLQIGPGIDGAPPFDINFGGDAKPFWRSVRDGACNTFSTVLGPGTQDGQHEDHLHLDLARHGRNGTRRVCR